jgi:hypothetical protein
MIWVISSINCKNSNTLVLVSVFLTEFTAKRLEAAARAKRMFLKFVSTLSDCESGHIVSLMCLIPLAACETVCKTGWVKTAYRIITNPGRIEID